MTPYTYRGVKGWFNGDAIETADYLAELDRKREKSNNVVTLKLKKMPVRGVAAANHFAKVSELGK